MGIGGIGMSSLAQHLLKVGCQVSGSDRQENEQTTKLRNLGVTVTVPHNAQCVQDAQLVVRTSAVSLQNEEVQYAAKHNIPVMLREELLGEIFDGFQTRIAVCGTHGKTTVTAMIHHMLERCGISHAAFIGGEYQNSNYFFGNNIVVAEACEYNRSFLHLHPTLCLCLNVEFDHPDCYKNLADVQQAFLQLFEQSENVIECSESKLRQNSILGCNGLSADNISIKDGYASFTLTEDGESICRCRLKVPGKHNVRNAVATLSVAKYLNLPLLQAAQSLSTFCGVDRRWTEKNCIFKVVCDYAHHPTEIRAVIQTAKEVCKGRIYCVFQPHTYSRTRALFSQFAQCFNEVDVAIFLPVYSAREKPSQGTAFQLYKEVKKSNHAKYFVDFQRTAQFLKNNVGPNDIVLLVGAGDVNKLAELLK